MPFFSDIPLIGELFKQRRACSEKSELVILLRPTVTDDQAWQQDIADSRQRLDALRDQLNTVEAPLPKAAQ